MPKIGDAPVGEKTSLDGTEKIPLTGSKWALISRLVAYLSGEGTLATKSYVDGIAVNLGKRQRVRAATTANITISTALNNGDTLDGVSLATGDLVLVKDQSTAAQNGVYVVGASPARASEFDTYDEHPGSLIAVQEGTANEDTVWLCTSNVGGTLNTTAIDFSAFTVGGGSGVAEDLTTSETDTSLVLAPDGAGGVEFRAEAGGGGGGAPSAVDPTTITGCIAWFDADQMSGSDGDLIASLTDFSASANHAVQATSGSKPKLRLNNFNNRNSIEFDGADDHLALGTNIDLTGGQTIIAVEADIFSRQNYNCFFNWKQTGLYARLATTISWGLYRTGDIYGGWIPPSSRPSIIGIWATSPTDFMFLNGTSRTQTYSGGTNNAATTSRIGWDGAGSQVFGGQFCELIVFNNKISLSDLKSLLKWLTYKWTGIISA